MTPASTLVSIVVTTVADALTSGSLNLYTGGAPATANSPATGTLLVAIPISGGSQTTPTPRRIVISGPMQAVALASGDAGYARVVDSQDQPLCDLPLAELTLSTQTITAGLIVTVTEIIIEVP